MQFIPIKLKFYYVCMGILKEKIYVLWIKITLKFLNVNISLIYIKLLKINFYIKYILTHIFFFN